LPGTTTIQYIVGITQYDLSKQSLLIGLFFLAASLGHAQMRLGLNKDSLWHLLAHTPADTNQVLLYITLGQQHEANDPDSALYFYKQAGELSKQLHYAVGELKYINNYTAVLNVQGKLDESVQLLLYAVRISEEHNLKSYQIKAYHNLGVVYQYQEDYTNAVKYYLKALGLLEQSSDVESQATLLANLSGLYRNLNQPDKAIDHGQRAVRISQANQYIPWETQALIWVMPTRISRTTGRRSYTMLWAKKFPYRWVISICRKQHCSIKPIYILMLVNL
jgi:tetratricopeptide (TPR) repeat protein